MDETYIFLLLIIGLGLLNVGFVMIIYQDLQDQLSRLTKISSDLAHSSRLQLRILTKFQAEFLDKEKMQGKLALLLYTPDEE